MGSSLFGVDLQSAVIDPTGVYRYLLTRQWSEAPPLVIGALNPSTADAEKNDATIRKEIGFAMRWGFGGIVKWNLYGLRSTDPNELLRHPEPIGPENDQHIIAACFGQPWVLAAWGSHKAARTRAPHVVKMLRDMGVTLKCLGLSKDGYPWHPLYIPYETQPVSFPQEGSR